MKRSGYYGMGDEKQESVYRLLYQNIMRLKCCLTDFFIGFEIKYLCNVEDYKIKLAV